jgi:hypothetical protein
MKKLIFFLMSAAVFGFLTSCDMNDDEYSMSNSWVGFGLIQEDSVSHTFTILLDEGEILFPKNSVNNWPDIKNNNRVLTNFTILGDRENSKNEEQYYVEINSIRKILYKGILNITPEIEDSIGNDPTKVRNKWLTNDMLNFELQYRGGSKTHFINLVKQPGEINIDNGPVLLELRHNTNGDEEQIPLSAIVTFDMTSLKVPGKTSTPFKVISKGFDGENFEYTGEYKY